MKKLLFIVLFSVGFSSCFHKSKIQLNFLDEFVIADSIKFKNTLIGGLSGVDLANGFYYFVVDDVKKPRLLKSKIKFDKDTIFSIDFVEIIFLNDTTETFYKNNALDLESVFIDKKTLEINLVSEGSISRNKNPSVFVIDSLGKFRHAYKIPNYFKANAPQKPKHNASFESSSRSIDGKGFWVGMESVLESDGKHPTFTKTQSPIRITYFDNEFQKATKQYAYQLDKIDKPAKGNVNLNGTTALLEYRKDNFFVIERAYQSGYGTDGNTIKIFNAKIEETSTNTLDILSLNNNAFTPLKKDLLLNLNTLKTHFTDSVIDNIEGITFGPTLSNGNKTLLLISDDNFQKYGKQYNQFILLEIVEK